MADFLLEIGCEEIPARMIDAASREMGERVTALLARERLAAEGSISILETPRRLAIMARGVPKAQQDLTERVNGPAVSVAYKDGRPTPAAEAFAKKHGLDVAVLERITTPKGEYVTANINKKGRNAAEILAESLPKEIASVYWPKNMYWLRPSERFVRPVRWLVAMLDGEVIPLDFYGTVAGNQSRGHRLLADGDVTIPCAGEAYVAALSKAKVLGRPEREQRIRQQLDACTRTIPGARWRDDAVLLSTVINLTEFPSVILGSFDPEFLELPDEVLVTVMRDHQKYFAIEDPEGRLVAKFLAVLNTDGDPDGVIRHGHERVLRARFNDARFFWQTDQKHDLRERVSFLRQVIFQKDLGSYYEKTTRVQALCRHISHMLRSASEMNDLPKVRAGVIHKAAWLAKADLTTELVKEFTELQGVIGGLYAQVQDLDHGLPKSTRLLIASAISDQYKPQSAEDGIPQTVEGAVLSIADKVDTIVGMFALGLVPSGSKDPFALRRQANGVVRIIAEQRLPLLLSSLLSCSFDTYEGTAAEKKFGQSASGWCEALRAELREHKTPDLIFESPRTDASPKAGRSQASLTLLAFFRERVQFYLRENRGYVYDVVNAVLNTGFNDVVDAQARAEAVSKARPSEDFYSISVAFKRIKNILRQSAESNKRIAPEVELDLLSEPAEKTLAAVIPQIAAKVEELRSRKDYDQSLIEISKLRPMLDTFFEQIMVMVDDERVRANRLALLKTLLREFSTIADFSEIVTEGKASEKSI